MSHLNKSSEFTLLTFTTFVPRPKKVQKFFLKFSDTVLIPPQAIEVCHYIKKFSLYDYGFYIISTKFTLIYKYNTIPCIAPGQHRNPCPVLEWLQEVVSVGSKACKEGKQTQLGLAEFL